MLGVEVDSLEGYRENVLRWWDHWGFLIFGRPFLLYASGLKPPVTASAVSPGLFVEGIGFGPQDPVVNGRNPCCTVQKPWKDSISQRKYQRTLWFQHYGFQVDEFRNHPHLDL